MDIEPNGRRYRLDEYGQPLINLEAESLRAATDYGYPRRAELSGPLVDLAMAIGERVIRFFSSKTAH